MSKAVMPSSEADRVAVAYSPRKFPASTSTIASDFVASKNTAVGSSFQIDRLVAKKTGVADLERKAMQEKIEAEALVRLKEIQEDAYANAYQVGLEEGREKAFQDHSADLEARIAKLDETIGSMETLKRSLLQANETHLVRLVYQIARQLMMVEFKEHPEFILDVIRQAVELAHSDEKLVIRLSLEDAQFIEGAKEKLGKEFEFIKRAEIEPTESLLSGGCTVETNYGAVDASIEQRTAKIWQALTEKAPRVPDVVTKAGT